MNRQADIRTGEGLRFFGTVTASVSHELKNVLAIINEIAGLFDDVSLMVAKGMPINPDRFNVLAAKMKTQIHRGDEIVKTLNRFAHSVDRDRVTVDLTDLVAFVVRLAERSAAMRGLVLTVKSPDGALTVLSQPFLLQHLIWVCLAHVMSRAEKGQTIESLTGPSDPDIRFHVPGGRLRAGGGETVFPDEATEALLDGLNARITTEPDSGELVLRLG